MSEINHQNGSLSSAPNYVESSCHDFLYFDPDTGDVSVYLIEGDQCRMATVADMQESIWNPFLTDTDHAKNSLLERSKS